MYETVPHPYLLLSGVKEIVTELRITPLDLLLPVAVRNNKENYDTDLPTPPLLVRPIFIELIFRYKCMCLYSFMSKAVYVEYNNRLYTAVALRLILIREICNIVIIGM